MLHGKGISKRMWLCIFLAEIAAVIAAGLFMKRQQPVELVYPEESLQYNTKEPEELGLRDYYATPSLSLSPGFYRVEVDCEYSDVQALDAEILYEENVQYWPLGTISLPVSTAEFRIKYENHPIQIVMKLNQNAAAEDYVLCRGVRIVSLPGVTMRNTLLKMGLLLVLADILLLWMTNRERFALRKEQKTCLKILIVLTVAVNIPVLANYLTYGHDLPFHLTRIEGLKEGLLNGDFPVKMHTYCLYGHGSPTSVFYGDLLLYIPAFLRVCGIPLYAAYNIYVLLINTGTVWISYYCFSRMSNMRIGLICAAVFSMNIYRLANIWTRAAVGEYTATMFMPLVVYGMWCIYACREDSEEFAGGWRPLTAGCTGIFLSHILSTEMTAFFLILAAILMWKKTFRRERLLVLCKAVLAAFILCLWFLIPFVDYMYHGNYIITDAMKQGYRAFSLEMQGTLPAQLLLASYGVTATSVLVHKGIIGNMPLTVGLASLLVLAAWFCLNRGGVNRRSLAENREARLAAWLSILSLLMTLYLFPYTAIAKCLPFLQSVFVSLQYPWRFLALAGIFLTWLLCVMLRGEWMTRRKKAVFAGILLVVAFWQGFSYMEEVLQENEPYMLYQTDFMLSDAVGNGEYLPAAGRILDILGYVKENKDTLIYEKEAVSISEWHREHGDFVMSLTNHTDQAQAVEVPIFNYKGYRVLADTGEVLSVQEGNYGRLAVVVPPSYDGVIRVAFCEPWYWRLSELISLGGLLVFLGLSFRRRTVGLRFRMHDKNLVVDA